MNGIHRISLDCLSANCYIGPKTEMVFIPNPVTHAMREIAPSIYQVRLPLPFALKIVNCYLIRDQHTWTVIDTGLNIPEARQVWIDTFGLLNIKPEQLERIILTHYHPDHYGLAGWLQEWCREQGAPVPPVYMSERDRYLAREIFRPDGNQLEVLELFFRRCGVPDALAATLTTDIQHLHGLIRPQPEPVLTLQPGECIEIGPYRFEILHTPGHSDGHLMFWDREQRLVLCGDHILLHITPNISLWPTTEPDPLGRYLASLDSLARLPVEVALPGHGPTISDWFARLSELKSHHRDRLDQMLGCINSHTSVYQVCTQVFETDNLSYHEIRFAITETLAHLDYLVRIGEIILSENGCWLYSKR